MARKKKCKEGYYLKEYRCVKKGVVEDLNPTTKRFFGLSQSQKYGFFLIILSGIIWLFRPFSDCAWYQIFCKGGGFIATPIFFVICLILLIIGIKKLVTK